MSLMKHNHAPRAWAIRCLAVLGVLVLLWVLGQFVLAPLQDRIRDPDLSPACFIELSCDSEPPELLFLLRDDSGKRSPLGIWTQQGRGLVAYHQNLAAKIGHGSKSVLASASPPVRLVGVAWYRHEGWREFAATLVPETGAWSQFGLPRTKLAVATGSMLPKATLRTLLDARYIEPPPATWTPEFLDALSRSGVLNDYARLDLQIKVRSTISDLTLIHTHSTSSVSDLLAACRFLAHHSSELDPAVGASTSECIQLEASILQCLELPAEDARRSGVASQLVRLELRLRGP